LIHEASKENINQVSGHFHPVASLRVNSKKITAKCLVHSENLIILPSYGQYTGGLNITKSPLREFIDVNSTIYLLSNKSVYKLPVSKIKNLL
jgi:metallophosphoesterase superfamily enzyme